MKHSLDFWEGDWEYPRLWMLPMIFSALSVIVGFIGIVPPFSGIGFLYAFVLGLVGVSGSIGLNITHMARFMSFSQSELFHEYRKTPKEIKSSVVKLKNKDILALDSESAEEAFRHLLKARDAFEQRKAIEDKHSGRGSVIMESLSEAVREQRMQLESTKEVYKELV